MGGRLSKIGQIGLYASVVTLASRWWNAPDRPRWNSCATGRRAGRRSVSRTSTRRRQDRRSGGSAQRLVARGHEFTNQLVLAREPQRLGWNQLIAEHHSHVFSD